MSSQPIDVAESLFQSGDDENLWRAATSRAYIAAFQHLLAHPRLSGFEQTRTGDDHRRVIEFLKMSQNASLRKIGFTFLPRLRALRNKADYDTLTPFTRAMAEEALERAHEIISMCGKG